MGITNVYGRKERADPQIHCRFERSKQKDLTKAVSNPKDPIITTQTQRLSTHNFFGFEHGILPRQTYSQCLSHLHGNCLNHLHGNLTVGKV
jgi:hypothetical protein